MDMDVDTCFHKSIGSFNCAASGHHALEDGVAGALATCSMPAAAHGIAWKRVEALINLAAIFDKLFRRFFQTLLHPCGNRHVAIIVAAIFFADNFGIKVKMKRTRLN